MFTNTPQLYFLDGTLVVEEIDQAATPPPVFRWIQGRWRCPAYHYRQIKPWLKAQNIAPLA